MNFFGYYFGQISTVLLNFQHFNQALIKAYSQKCIWLTDETTRRYQFTGEEAPMLIEEMVENPESDWDEDDEEDEEEEEEDDNQWNIPALD